MTSIGIRTLSERVGVSPHTLRYYERAGLMIAVPRDAAGRRVYGPEQERWVAFLLRLRESGMGIADIREYAGLIREGTDPEGRRRHEILSAHRDRVRETILRLTRHLEVLDRKVEGGCAPDAGEP